jgi:hypothetical protein
VVRPTTSAQPIEHRAHYRCEEAENVIKIRKGGQVRCNRVGLTDMITHDDLRSTIARHIEEARRMVTEQKGRIARLKATGVDTALAELTLRALEANLKRFQNHSDWSERKNRIRQSRLGFQRVTVRGDLRAASPPGRR